MMPIKGDTVYRTEDSSIPLTDTVNALSVTAGGPAETLTIPSGATFVRFSANGNFYVRANAVAAEVAADITNGTASILNPSGLMSLDGVTSISVIGATGGATVITAEFFG